MSLRFVSRIAIVVVFGFVIRIRDSYSDSCSDAPRVSGSAGGETGRQPLAAARSTSHATAWIVTGQTLRRKIVRRGGSAPDRRQRGGFVRPRNEDADFTGPENQLEGKRESARLQLRHVIRYDPAAGHIERCRVWKQ